MGSFPAPGLPASWLNGWLAAVGATFLVPDLRLAWTEGPAPIALFDQEADDVATKIAQALPTVEQLGRLAIARTRPDASEFPRKATLDQFRARAQLIHSGAVACGDRSLEMSTTDLYDLKVNEVPHAPFDPPGPGTIGSLHDRLVKCKEQIEQLGDPTTLVDASLRGRGRRVKASGLGFDYQRNATGMHPKSGPSEVAPHVDPIVETLAFFGLHLFPLRGSARAKQDPVQRGFVCAKSGRHAFRWPCWRDPLDLWAIDALLDRFHAIAPKPMQAESGDGWHPRRLRVLSQIGIHAVYGSVYQIPKGDEKNRSFASERLR